MHVTDRAGFSFYRALNYACMASLMKLTGSHREAATWIARADGHAKEQGHAGVLHWLAARQ